MKASDLKDRIAKMYSHVLFEYKGRSCGVDPLTETRFNMWFGGDLITLSSVEDVMQIKFFGGKSLNEIAKEIEIYE